MTPLMERDELERFWSDVDYALAGLSDGRPVKGMSRWRAAVRAMALFGATLAVAAVLALTGGSSSVRMDPNRIDRESTHQAPKNVGPASEQARAGSYVELTIGEQSIHVMRCSGSGCLDWLNRPPAAASSRTTRYFGNANVHRPHRTGAWTVAGRSGQ
jgi:hypothetical protein